jgi:hypothetical protein
MTFVAAQRLHGQPPLVGLRRMHVSLRRAA